MQPTWVVFSRYETERKPSKTERKKKKTWRHDLNFPQMFFFVLMVCPNEHDPAFLPWKLAYSPTVGLQVKLPW